MWTIVWEFRVAPKSRESFERAYGPAGDWATLFALSPEFRGTMLLRDPAVPGRYLTIDRWGSAMAFEHFKEHHAEEYKALDARCEELTEYEMKIGSFEHVG